MTDTPASGLRAAPTADGRAPGRPMRAPTRQAGTRTAATAAGSPHCAAQRRFMTQATQATETATKKQKRRRRARSSTRPGAARPDSGASSGRQHTPELERPSANRGTRPTMHNRSTTDGGGAGRGSGRDVRCWWLRLERFALASRSDVRPLSHALGPPLGRRPLLSSPLHLHSSPLLSSHLFLPFAHRDQQPKTKRALRLTAPPRPEVFL